MGKAGRPKKRRILRRKNVPLDDDLDLKEEKKAKKGAVEDVEEEDLYAQDVGGLYAEEDSAYAEKEESDIEYDTKFKKSLEKQINSNDDEYLGFPSPPSKDENIANEEISGDKTFIHCVMCNKSKVETTYYVNYSNPNFGNRIPYCKQCIKSFVYLKNGSPNVHKIKKFLQMIDRPYIHEVWLSVKSDWTKDAFGMYMKNLALHQYRYMVWNDSIMENGVVTTHKDRIIKDFDDYKITDDLLVKWGFGYTKEEYQYFERKYHLLKNNYPEKTAMHTEALLNYIRYRVKEELATASGDVKEAKEWGGLAEKAAQAAKINPNQLSASDLQDGLSTFGQLVRAVEQSVDIIPILPKFKKRPQDHPDFVLYCLINYARDLKGLPLCEYEEIWQFYEDRKREHASRLDFLSERDKEVGGD